MRGVRGVRRVREKHVVCCMYPPYGALIVFSGEMQRKWREMGLA
jgi:hypothetical protein